MCVKDKAREAEKARQIRVGDCLLVPSLGGGVGRSESSGSSAALMNAGPSASSTASSLHNVSGES